MARTAIVTDTNASLPGNVVKKFGIIEVPMQIQFGDESYVTGVDIDDEKLIQMIDARNLLPTTAAPSPAAFQEAYQKAFDEGAEQIVCICCSSRVSATLQVAELAKEDFVDHQITVVDSFQLSLGEGFQVIGAVEAGDNGASLEEILNGIERIRKHSHVYGALPTLKYLAMGGRMRKLVAGLGNSLEVKPILTTMDGKLELLGKIRTWRKAKGRLIELAVACGAGQQIERMGLVHVNNKDGVMSLWEEIRTALNLSIELLVTEFTPGLSVHNGSGVIVFVLITA